MSTNQLDTCNKLVLNFNDIVKKIKNKTNQRTKALVTYYLHSLLGTGLENVYINVLGQKHYANPTL